MTPELKAALERRHSGAHGCVGAGGYGSWHQFGDEPGHLCDAAQALTALIEAEGQGAALVEALGNVWAATPLIGGYRNWTVRTLLDGDPLMKQIGAILANLTEAAKAHNARVAADAVAGERERLRPVLMALAEGFEDEIEAATLQAEIDNILGGKASAEDLARRFHQTYERLAPDFGYRTREASAVPWEQVPEANRRLMIATCAALLAPSPEPHVCADGCLHDCPSCGHEVDHTAAFHAPDCAPSPEPNEGEAGR